MFLLRETDRSVTEICLDVGFTSLVRSAGRSVTSSVNRRPRTAGARTFGLSRRVSRSFRASRTARSCSRCPGPPAMDEAMAERVRELMTKGATSGWLGFTVDDCQKTYETL